MNSYCPKDLPEGPILWKKRVTKGEGQSPKDTSSMGPIIPFQKTQLELKPEELKNLGPKPDPLKLALQENEDLMARLSTTLKKNSFFESKVQFLEKWNQQLTESNTSLKDQFLSLKQRYRKITKDNSEISLNLKTNSEDLKNLKNQLNVLKFKAEIKAEKEAKLKLLTQQNKSLNNKNQELLEQIQQLKQYLSRVQQEKTVSEQKELKLKKIKLKLALYLKQISQKKETFYKWHKKVLLQNQQQWDIKKQNLLNQQAQIFNRFKKETQKLLKENANIISDLKIGHKKETQKLIDSHKKQSHKKEIQHQQSTNQIIQQKDREHQLLSQKHSQIIKSSQLNTDRWLKKYTNLKNKWNKRVTKIIAQKNKVITKVCAQYEQKIKSLTHSFKEKEQHLYLKQEKEKQSLLDKTQTLLKQKAEQANLTLRLQKELRGAQKQEKILLEKEKFIAELKQELENQTTEQGKLEELIKKEFQQEKEKLSQQHQSTLDEIQQNYALSLAGLKEENTREITNIKTTYQQKLDKKTYALDNKMIELKEEHDNNLHNLRVEMEQELMAEKRSSQTENSKNLALALQAQKALSKLKADMEVKNLKLLNLDLDSVNREQELKTLRKENQDLKCNYHTLQILWENKEPEMEEQQKQIQNLQKWNRHLSQYIHTHFEKETPTQKLTTKKPATTVALPTTGDNLKTAPLTKPVHSHWTKLLKDIHLS